jgi:hypothetical protein
LSIHSRRRFSIVTVTFCFGILSIHTSPSFLGFTLLHLTVTKVISFCLTIPYYRKEKEKHGIENNVKRANDREV